MVGSGIKKYAKENGLTVKNGVAYGVYRGYMITMQEGAGWKSVDFAVWMDNDLNLAVQNQLRSMFDEQTKKDYRVMDLAGTNNCISVKFFDNPGTMAKVKDVIDLMVNRLSACQVPGAGYCAHCGQPIDGSASAETVMVKGAVHQMHSGCAASVERELGDAREELQSQGSVASGAIGAVLGGIVGVIPWAIASYLGVFVGWLGFLIGFAAKKGYELLKGKECKTKAFIIIVVTILCVILAEIAGYGVMFMTEFELSFAESIELFFQVLEVEPEAMSEVVGNLALGLVFAGLGIFDVVRDVLSANSNKNTSVTRM